MITQKNVLVLTTALALCPFAPSEATAASEAPDLSAWDKTVDAKDDWRAQDFYGLDVIGENGQQIGDVRNIIIGPDGHVGSIIVESGGLLDIGDTHLKVAWEDVTVADDGQSVSVPILAHNVADFSLFNEPPEVGPRSWRAAELINDFVRLNDEVGYGIVEDLVFSEDGKLQAVLVRQDLAYGNRMVNRDLHAFPFLGYDHGFEPGAGTYKLPYGRETLVDREPYGTL